MVLLKPDQCRYPLCDDRTDPATITVGRPDRPSDSNCKFHDGCFRRWENSRTMLENPCIAAKKPDFAIVCNGEAVKNVGVRGTADVVSHCGAKACTDAALLEVHRRGPRHCEAIGCTRYAQKVTRINDVQHFKCVKPLCGTMVVPRSPDVGGHCDQCGAVATKQISNPLDGYAHPYKLCDNEECYKNACIAFAKDNHTRCIIDSCGKDISHVGVGPHLGQAFSCNDPMHVQTANGKANQQEDCQNSQCNRGQKFGKVKFYQGRTGQGHWCDAQACQDDMVGECRAPIDQSTGMQ